MWCNHENKRDSGVFVIAAYGGHAGYAYAVATYLVKMGIKDITVLVAEGYEFIARRFQGLGEAVFLTLPRKPGEKLVKGLGRWIKAFYQSTKLATLKGPRVVFAGGSNFSIPPSVTAKLLKRASIYTIEAIEHFTKPSRAVKILEVLGGKVFLHWEEQLNMFPKGIVVGPVYEPPIYEPRDEGYILVTTGTLGFKELYDAIGKLKIEHVVLQTGDIDPEQYSLKNPNWIVFRYTEDIHKWIAGASIVITQQGLTAATASLAYGKPVIVVWNPRVVLGAPKRDIEIYAEKIGAVFLEKPDVSELKKAVEKVTKPSKKYRNGAELVARILAKELLTS